MHEKARTPQLFALVSLPQTGMKSKPAMLDAQYREPNVTLLAKNFPHNAAGRSWVNPFKLLCSNQDHGVIDIHCHILPEVDDGPKTWDVAVEMCRMAAADGITHTVATPHANDRYAYDRAYLSDLLSQLREKVGSTLQFSLGCDFHLSYENLERVLDQPHDYTIGETNYLLIELSNYSIPTQLADCFRRLGDRGLTPILTHPERNPILQQTPQRVLEYADQGCLVQVTASSLTGFWGERPEIVARWLLDRSAVHILATDAHETRRRVPVLSEARDVVARLLGAEYADALVEGNPGAIVKGMPIPYCPRPVLD